jgi:hypothetical protein
MLSKMYNYVLFFSGGVNHSWELFGSSDMRTEVTRTVLIMYRWRTRLEPVQVKYDLSLA